MPDGVCTVLYLFVAEGQNSSDKAHWVLAGWLQPQHGNTVSGVRPQARHRQPGDWGGGRWWWCPVVLCSSCSCWLLAALPCVWWEVEQ